MFEKFSQRAGHVFFLARFKAGQRGAKAIELEDLLVSLVIEDQGKFQEAVSGVWTNGTPVIQPETPPQNPFIAPEIAGELLARFGAPSPQGEPLPTSAEMPLSQASKNALSRANSLCDELQHSSIEPLHLLAAILENQKNKAAQVFRDAGITREKIIPFLKGEQ
ncbi:MAG TPA: Clp protease N-terminal domain-containing protein [Terriglobia bacterium]|nr:Clp protease N-terminal domain-containing protein [Terriglobia bacterium]